MTHTGADDGSQPCRLGVLAFGDSITNGGGELQWGVALQSWALWVARALGLPFTSHALDGATVRDVLDAQIPAFRSRTERTEARYDVGCLYIGVNDVRRPEWDAATYCGALEQALRFLTARCDRTLALTAPLDLGRPRTGARVAEMNAAVRRAAATTGCLVVDLSDFGARNRVMTDHVHPTAFGQVEIAERALAVLATAGQPAKIAPSRLISYETSWYGRLQGDATYVYRHAKVTARAWWSGLAG
jgi:lysophospholipase L1-like esterase